MDNSEPVVPMKKQELTGVFWGEWNYCDDLTYPIEVNDGYIFVDELPVEAIFYRIKQHVLVHEDSRAIHSPSRNGPKSSLHHQIPGLRYQHE